MWILCGRHIVEKPYFSSVPAVFSLSAWSPKIKFLSRCLLWDTEICVQCRASIVHLFFWWTYKMEHVVLVWFIYLYYVYFFVRNNLWCVQPVRSAILGLFLCYFLRMPYVVALHCSAIKGNLVINYSSILRSCRVIVYLFLVHCREIWEACNGAAT